MITCDKIIIAKKSASTKIFSIRRTSTDTFLTKTVPTKIILTNFYI